MKKVVLLTTAVVAATSINAQAGWFDQGMELLKEATKTTATTTTSPTSGALSQQQIVEGLKEALKVGSERVVNQLGVKDGFNADPKIHIPLPQQLQTVSRYLEPLGMQGVMDDLELRLNRAAENATPEAQALFINAIKQMSFDDARQIYQGADNAATEYFKEKMGPQLKTLMRPIIEDNLQQAGAVRLYDQAMGQYQSLPFVPDVKANLIDYVVDQGFDGIFHYIAQEEIAIRNNPAERTTELLKQVFGGG